MSAKNSTFLNTLLGVTWGMSTTSTSLYLYLPISLSFDLFANIVFGIAELVGEPIDENWYSHYAVRDAYGAVRSKRQGLWALGFNGLFPHVFAGAHAGMTVGQVMWARKRDWEWFDLPRMVEVWDIDGSAGLAAFDRSGSPSAVALVAETGGKVRLHATSWSRGFGNSVDAANNRFTDKAMPGDTFARGMIHLAEQLPEGFPTGTGTTLRVDEYTNPATLTSVAAIETSLAFRLRTGKVQPGEFLQVAAPRHIPPPPPIIARVKAVATEPYDGFYREIERDIVTLETELPETFADGKLHVRRLNNTSGTSRSGPWQGGPANLTQAEAETLPALKQRELLRIEASGGEISFAQIDRITLDLHLAPPLLDPPEQPEIDLLRADKAFTATLKDFTEPGKLTLSGGHPNVDGGDLLLVRLGTEKRCVAITAVNGDEITIFPSLDFPELELHNGTLVNVQRWVPAGEKDRATFQLVNGNAITVEAPRAGLFSKGSMVSFTADGKRAFREVEKMTSIALVLANPAAGTAPFTIEAAQFDKSLDQKRIDVVKRHRRLRWVSGDRPSAYGTFPQFLLGVRPMTRASGTTLDRETMFFTNGLANADAAYHRTWTPFSEGGNDYWLLGGDLPIDVRKKGTFWQFHPESENRFEADLRVEVVEYAKGAASRADGTPAGARIRVYAPEVQVPETPSITDTHQRAVLEHELKHTYQAAHWGPLYFMLPVPGVAKLIATLRQAAGSTPAPWAQRLLDNEGLEPIEYASFGGLMQLLYELFIPGKMEDSPVSTETWQIIFNPIGGTLSAVVPELDPQDGGGKKFGIALLQLLSHAFDFRSWTPGLGIYPWVLFDGDRNFMEQQASRASGEMYTTTLSADDRFNADYKTYLIPHKLREADGSRSLGSVTRMMTWGGYTTYTLLSLQHANANGSPVQLNSIGGGTVDQILSFTADAEVLVPAELYDAAGTPLTVEGPDSLARVPKDFHVVPAGTRITPRLRSFVPTPPRVNRSTGYFFIPAAAANYTLNANGYSDEPGTDEVKMTVDAGHVTLGRATVPYARPAAVGAALGTLPVFRIPEGLSRSLSRNGPTTGWTADLDSSAQFTLSAEAQGWRITAPAAFSPGVSVRVRLYRVLEASDAAFDLTYDAAQVPSLQGVRSLLDTPVFIPARDFVIELVRAQKAEVVLNGNASPASHYIGWTPRPATIRLTEAGGATGPTKVTLRNATSGVGRVVFSTTSTGTATDTLVLDLPANGSTVPFFVRGKFGSPSKRDKDAVFEVVNEDGDLLSRTELMVRVRKNALSLEDHERDRFLSAMSVINTGALPPYTEIRNMHVSGALDEAHGSGDPDFHDGFLPWHRAYLLDLERRLQVVDPSVALPYWVFDERAPAVFTADFMGAPNGSGTALFSSSNPLQFWPAFQRTPDALWNIATQGARNAFGVVRSERSTLRLGSNYRDFVLMERDPHDMAHSSFSGPLSNPATAPLDPIFFLLHANVDRLWAKWQREEGRFDPAVQQSYSFRGTPGNVTRVGHNLNDTMWPWNGVTGLPRPPVAPGGGLPPSPVTGTPSTAPTVGDMLDYQGRLGVDRWQGFDYDDVEF